MPIAYPLHLAAHAKMRYFEKREQIGLHTFFKVRKVPRTVPPHRRGGLKSSSRWTKRRNSIGGLGPPACGTHQYRAREQRARLSVVARPRGTTARKKRDRHLVKHTTSSAILSQARPRAPLRRSFFRSFGQNPMSYMMVVTVAVVVFMPKMMANMDKDQLKEMQEQMEGNDPQVGRQTTTPRVVASGAR